jgi:hypothetical protein
MSRSFNSSSNGLYSASPPVTQGPFTISCWTNAPTGDGTNARRMVTLWNSNISSIDAYILSLHGAADEGIATTYQANTALSQATVASASPNTWQHLCGSWTPVVGSESTLVDSRVILNGDLTDIGYRYNCAKPAGINAISVGAIITSAGTNYGGGTNGLIAHVAIWNSILSEAQVVQLANGALPTDVSRDTLVAYWPLVGSASPEPDTVGSYNLTLSSTPGQGMHVYLPAEKDIFTRSTLGNNWIPITSHGSLDISTNRAHYSTAGVGGAIRNGNFGPNQFSQATYVTSSSGKFGLCVRTNAAGTQGYAFRITSGPTYAMYKSDGAQAWTALSPTGSITSYTVGDVFNLEVIGSTVKVYQNRVEKLSVTDTTFTSGGAPGMLPWDGNAGADVYLDDWLGGEIKTPYLLQNKWGLIDSTATAISVTLDNKVAVGSLIVVTCVGWDDNYQAYTAGDCTQTAGTATLSSFTLDAEHNVAYTGGNYNGTWSAVVTGAGTLTVTIANHPTNLWLDAAVSEYKGIWDANRVESMNEAQDTVVGTYSGTVTAEAGSLLIGSLGINTGVVHTIVENNYFLPTFEVYDGTVHEVGGAYYRVIGENTTTELSVTISANTFWDATLVEYSEVSAGIAQCPAPTIDDSGTNNTTIAQTITGVATGSTLVVIVGSSKGTDVSCTVSDGTSYTAVGTRVTDTGNNQVSWAFYLPNAASGSHTVTATFNESVPYRRIRIAEVVGVETSGVLDVYAAQFNDTLSTNTDAITSGTVSTTNANNLLIGLTQDTSETTPGTGALSAGTSFILPSVTNRLLGVESRVVSSTGSYAATFTQSSGANATTHMLALKLANSNPTNLIQSVGNFGDSSTTANVSTTTSVTAGSLLVITGNKFSPSNGAFTLVSLVKTAGTATLGTITLDSSTNWADSGSYASTAIWSVIVTGSGTLTMQVEGMPGGSYILINISEWEGSWDASRVETSGNTTTSLVASSGTVNGNSLTSAGPALFISTIQINDSTAITLSNGNNFVKLYEQTIVDHDNGNTAYKIATAGMTTNSSWTMVGTGNIQETPTSTVVYKLSSGSPTYKSPLFQFQYRLRRTN